MIRGGKKPKEDMGEYGGNWYEEGRGKLRGCGR